MKSAVKILMYIILKALNVEMTQISIVVEVAADGIAKPFAEANTAYLQQITLENTVET